MKLIPLVILLFFCIRMVNGQSQKNKLHYQSLSIQIVPHLGTTSFPPGSVINQVSLNIFTGYSFANHGLMITGISAMNVSDTKGIQLSGISNSTGINYELSPFSEENGEASLTGIQLSGLHNYVRDYINGAQISGLYNRGRNLMGFQLGTINRLTGFGFGAQLGILYNWSVGSFDGVQLGVLANETNSRLVGLQMATLNIARLIEGKNSDPDAKLTGFQIGIINFAKEMHGYQLGVINISGKMRGTQLGLINIASQGGVPVNKRNGSMIGLFNVGLFHSLAITTGDIFKYNILLQTGTMKNGNFRGEKTNRYLTSSLEYSFSAYSNEGYRRQLGVGLHKYYYNRTVTPGMNEKRFWQVSTGLHYLQSKAESFSDGNFYTRIGAEAGYRMINKLSLYFVLRADINYSWNGLPDTQVLLSSSSLGDGTLWPGFRAGLQIH